jgi:hypothetical protein
MPRRLGVIYGTAFALSLVTLLATYFPFVWLLIRLQTWRLGHPNPFAIGPAVDAVWCSVLVAMVVFWLVVKRAKRNQTK